MSIPIELLDAFASHLALRASDSKFKHDRQSVHALYQLCLTNHTFNQIATPYLYSSIEVVTKAQLERFHFTITRRKPQYAPYIQSFCLAHLDSFLPPPLSTSLAEIIDCLGPTIRRVVTDRANDHYRPVDGQHVVLNSIGNCRVLEEWCTIASGESNTCVWSVSGVFKRPNRPNSETAESFPDL